MILVYSLKFHWLLKENIRLNTSFIIVQKYAEVSDLSDATVTEAYWVEGPQSSRPILPLVHRFGHTASAADNVGCDTPMPHAYLPSDVGNMVVHTHVHDRFSIVVLSACLESAEESSFGAAPCPIPSNFLYPSSRGIYKAACLTMKPFYPPSWIKKQLM